MTLYLFITPVWTRALPNQVLLDAFEVVLDAHRDRPGDSGIKRRLEVFHAEIRRRERAGALGVTLNFPTEETAHRKCFDAWMDVDS